MDLYFYNYNNYYNRQFKVEQSLAGYGTPVFVQSGVQGFQFNDGISTQQVINLVPYNTLITPDYMVLVDNNTINSRWFVIEQEYNRAGQYIVTLYRDTLADSFEYVKDAPCFIEKATLSDDDYAIFNSEDMQFNQIKSKETALKDATNSAWIVGYYAKNTSPDNLKGTVDSSSYSGAIAIGTTFEQWTYHQYVAGVGAENTYFGAYPSAMTYVINTNIPGDFWHRDRVAHSYINRILSSVTTEVNIGQTSSSSIYGKSIDISTDALSNAYLTQFSLHSSKGRIDNCFFTDNTHNHTSNQTVDFLRYNNKIIVDTNGKYYRLSYGKVQRRIQQSVTASAYPTLYPEFTQAIYTNGSFRGTLPNYIQGSVNSYTFGLDYTFDDYIINATELPQLATTYDLTENQLSTKDSPYDIFAIPYGDIEVVTEHGTIKTAKDFAMKLAQTISVNLSSFGYDLQLLPYCPVLTDSSLMTDGKLVLNTGDLKKMVNYAKHTESGTTTYHAVILNVEQSQLNFQIPVTLDATDGINDPMKVRALCTTHRLVSPNYSGMFEFNVAKNGGLEYIDVDYNLKPYSPYIHLNPNFGKLYGTDYNDARGLICGGDFSLPIINDRWEEYQVNNKTYAQAFDRQIQNMETNNSITKEKEIWSAAVGTIQGATTGGFMGNTMGGTKGATIGGAVAGGVASFAGGVADVVLNDKLRNEALDYTKDMYGYNLQNIQALPYSLSRVSAYNANNKVFPILEVYTCTEQEKQALIDKVTYNGMTVMRIGTIGDYIKENPTYIKGRIIRIENLDEDYHYLKTIANEIYKGVFI